MGHRYADSLAYDLIGQVHHRNILVIDELKVPQARESLLRGSDGPGFRESVFIRDSVSVSIGFVAESFRSISTAWLRICIILYAVLSCCQSRSRHSFGAIGFAVAFSRILIRLALSISQTPILGTILCILTSGLFSSLVLQSLSCQHNPFCLNSPTADFIDLTFAQLRWRSTYRWCNFRCANHCLRQMKTHCPTREDGATSTSLLCCSWLLPTRTSLKMSVCQPPHLPRRN